MDIVHLGSTIKVNVHAEGTPAFTMQDCDFRVCVFTAQKDSAITDPLNLFNKKYEVSKTDCVKIDGNNYVVEVPTERIGKGYVIVRLEILVPDTECASNFRKEVLQEKANIQIV